MFFEGLDDTFCYIHSVIVQWYKLPLTLLGLEEHPEGHSHLVISHINEGMVSFLNKDVEDVLEGVNDGLILDIWNGLRKNIIVVVIICDEEILVRVQQTQWEGSRGISVQCALLRVGQRGVSENVAVYVIVGRNHSNNNDSAQQ